MPNKSTTQTRIDISGIRWNAYTDEQMQRQHKLREEAPMLPTPELVKHPTPTSSILRGILFGAIGVCLMALITVAIFVSWYAIHKP